MSPRTELRSRAPKLVRKSDDNAIKAAVQQARRMSPFVQLALADIWNQPGRGQAQWTRRGAAVRSRAWVVIPSARGDVSDLISAVGQEISARGRALPTAFRTAELLGLGLDRFAGIAGGELIRVQAGSGDYAFDRVLLETAADYLPGVEPAPTGRRLVYDAGLPPV